MILLLLSGCSTSGSWRAQISPELSLPVSVTLDDTPFFPQDRYHCGPAALATVLNASGIETTPDELLPYVYLPGRQGSLQLDMIATTRRFKRLPYKVDASLAAVLTEIANGQPVLVMQNLGLSWYPQWHYAVLIGYDLNQNTVTLRSGKERRHVIPIDTFEQTWARAGHWAIMTVKPNEIPVTANASGYLRLVHDFETLHPEQAVTAYQTAIVQWQDEPLLWLALGNLYYQQKQFKRSVETFREGLAYHPQQVQLWNNYAYGLRARGCQAASLSAIQCAIQINPADPALRQSLAELQGSGIEMNQGCPVLSCPQ
ncbi:PA2778 family cysteine peptidase [Photobacterium atrarenae]|uniref:PA2778 family cysteine peptidase n=1 Tax=Photobacterium atrarenae TaxID=865757 RepID=A0ABY5GP29_9GAMM|nr:PA2778 family cysteine peptidase [Photobacterium atrarenae]UTV30521.1 PA2778 family cysteine peptidase [Photobacterium atrarenae]